MSQTPLNYALIPAASLPWVLRGIRWGSVDAVSDTFRFLPFIFPPTQSPRTVAAETCDFPKYREKGGSALEADSCSIIYQKISKSYICMWHTNENVAPSSHFSAHVSWIETSGFKYTNSPQCTWEAHSEITCGMIYYAFIAVCDQQSVTK